MNNQSDNYRTYTRHDTLRLRTFNYAAKRIYFVTMVTVNRQQHFLDQRLANATLDCLFEFKQERKFNVYVYCLMPDHFHALIGIGESNKNLGEIYGAFKSLSTRVFWRWYEGRLWQRQFFDHIIRNEKDFYETIEYIKQNPVRKGLVQSPDDWLYTGKFDDWQ